MLSFTPGHPTAGSATPASRAASPLTAQRGGWNCGLRFSRKAAKPSCASKGLGKQGFYAQIGLDQDNAYAFAVELMSSAAMIPDAQEGFAAFLEKRKPQFQPPR